MKREKETKRSGGRKEGGPKGRSGAIESVTVGHVKIVISGHEVLWCPR